MQVKPVLPPLVSRADADSKPQSNARQEEREKRQSKKSAPSESAKTPVPPSPAPAEVTELKSEDFLALLDKTKSVAPSRNPFATEAEKTVKNLDKKL